MIKLFDFCIAPILLYGSEIWSAYLDYDEINWDTTTIERTHTQFLKRVLGVNRSTTNVMVRSELGRYSLQEKILKRNIMYLKYIAAKDPLSLVRQAMNYEVTQIDNRGTLFSVSSRGMKID